MTSGGSRTRSGPRPDERSGRSDRRGYKLDELPAEGYDGPVPDFPLPEATARELEVWETTWLLPQGCAWSLPSESWRLFTIAMWVRVSVRCEQPDAPASLLAQLHRFADQIGMTTNGLAAMGWKVANPTPAAPATRPPSRERRLRSVPERRKS